MDLVLQYMDYYNVSKLLFHMLVVKAVTLSQAHMRVTYYSVYPKQYDFTITQPIFKPHEFLKGL